MIKGSTVLYYISLCCVIRRDTNPLVGFLADVTQRRDVALQPKWLQKKVQYSRDKDLVSLRRYMPLK